MKNVIRKLFTAAIAVIAVSSFTHNLAGQDDDRDRQMQRYRDRLEVKSDPEWKQIEPLVGKVIAAQRDARMGIGEPGGPGGPGGGRLVLISPGDEAPREVEAPRDLSPEVAALQKAIDDKAPADEIKAKLAKVRETRKTKEGNLDRARAGLQKALSPRQEAAAVLAGLLK